MDSDNTNAETRIQELERKRKEAWESYYSEHHKEMEKLYERKRKAESQLAHETKYGILGFEKKF